MSLEDWINGTAVCTPATATPATVATVPDAKSRSVAEVATVAVAETQNRETGGVDQTQGLAAVELLSRAGARILPHHLRTIAVRKHHDTLEVRRALALLGYGAYAVAHLDPDDQGRSDDDKEQQELWELYDLADDAINGYQR